MKITESYRYLSITLIGINGIGRQKNNILKRYRYRYLCKKQLYWLLQPVKVALAACPFLILKQRQKSSDSKSSV